VQLEVVAAWTIVNIWPATVTVPLRAGPVFGTADHAIVAFPAPDDGVVSVIQGAFAIALQVQVAADVVRTNEPAAAPESMLADGGAIV
jgi:hypothetical protein